MKIMFSINGATIETDVDGEQKLLYFIRDQLGLTGTKPGCEIGECGTCSVIMDKKLVKSCLIPMKKVDGKEIITIEGICSDDGQPNDLQQAFLDFGATQCGYCTPGMILAGEVLLMSNRTPTREDIRKAISGNLCRCTGYQQIIDAIEATAKLRNQQETKAVGG